MLIKLGDKSLFSMACLRTVLCHGCLLFAHLGCLGGGDNYSDSGGRLAHMLDYKNEDNPL